MRNSLITALLFFALPLTASVGTIVLHVETFETLVLSGRSYDGREYQFVSVRVPFHLSRCAVEYGHATEEFDVKDVQLTDRHIVLPIRRGHVFSLALSYGTVITKHGPFRAEELPKATYEDGTLH